MTSTEESTPCFSLERASILLFRARDLRIIPECGRILSGIEMAERDGEANMHCGWRVVWPVA